MKRNFSSLDATNDIGSQIATLSTEKQMLLKHRLKKKSVDGHTFSINVRVDPEAAYPTE